MRYAVIDNNGKVINFVKVSSKLKDNWVEVDDTIDVNIGYTYDGNTFNPPPIDIDELKKRKIEELQIVTTSYIDKYYPDVKQRSDVADKEYFGSWLITHFPETYTADNLYQKMFNASAKVVEGTDTFDNVLESLKEITEFESDDIKEKYYLALEQLLKVAIRQGWVQECKLIYNIAYEKVINAETQSDIEAIDISFSKYPLKDN